MGQVEAYEAIKKSNIDVGYKRIKIDSLLKVVFKSKDTIQILTLGDRMNNWFVNNGFYRKGIGTIDSLLKFVPESDLKLSQKLAYKKLFWKKRYFNSPPDIITLSRDIVKKDAQSRWARLTRRKLGSAYLELGDYFAATCSFEMATSQFQVNGEQLDAIKSIINSTDAYLYFNETTTQKRILELLLGANKIVDQDSTIRNRTRINTKRVLGGYYITNKLFNSVKARKYLEEALLIASREADSLQIAAIQVDLGRVFMYDKPDLSKTYFKNALLFLDNKNDSLLQVILSNLFILEIRDNKWADGNRALEDLLKLMSLPELKTFEVDMINIERLKSQSILNNDWRVLYQLAQFFEKKYAFDGKEENLKRSLALYDVVGDVIETFSNNTVYGNQSKLALKKDIDEIAIRAIRSSYTAGDINKAWYFMEQKKATLLNAEVAEKERFQNAPDLFKAQTKQNRLARKFLKNLEGGPIGSNTKISILDSLEQLNFTITDLRKTLDTLPNRESLKLIPINTLQKQLKNEEVIVEYTFGQDEGEGVYPNTEKGYVIVISKTETHFVEIPNVKELQKDVLHYKNFLKVPQKTAEALKNFKIASHSLFKRLIPDEVFAMIKSKEVHIIPDYFLNGVPFETLIVDPKASEQGGDYLLKHAIINYQLSASFYFKNLRDSKKQSTRALAIAPISFQKTNLPDLEYSESEIAALSEYYNSTTLTAQEAVKSNFEIESQGADIIHLATHATSPDSPYDLPFIQFYDSVLTYDELSLLNNKASLLVLSACDSGTGQYANGEGVMSLVRSAFYSGTKSTIASLWQISDRATSIIFSSFYKYMADGQSKSKALRQAKIDYLSQATGSELSPYYWSGLVLTGNADPLTNVNNTSVYVFFTLLLGVGGYFIFRIRKKICSSNNAA